MAQTQCIDEQLTFQGLGGRKVVATADAGAVSSDAGLLLLREVSVRTGMLERFAGCFVDRRDSNRIDHTIEDLVSQRVYAICAGYEDLNDHDTLRVDPLLATVVGKSDPEGFNRKRTRDKGRALAGKSTLGRLENGPSSAEAMGRYHRIGFEEDAMDRLLVDLFMDAHDEAPETIVLDLDATDDPLHGSQEGRFFHGYYGCYCYLPLYIFCGDHLLVARLRSSDIDGAFGSVEELERIMLQVRERWPDTEVIIRGDAGFARDEIMSWCETNQVHFVLGMARNPRLVASIGKQLERARRQYLRTEQASRVFRDFRYRTRTSWSRQRRIVGKAEHLRKGTNPRFVVTSLPKDRFDARALYEDLYCARGDMENRIKEQQLGLFADRTSAHTMRANQLRLYFSSMAYVLMNELRRSGLRLTKLARAQMSTIRTKLIKIGAVVRVSVRRVHVSMNSSSPYHALLRTVLGNLRAAYPLPD